MISATFKLIFIEIRVENHLIKLKYNMNQNIQKCLLVPVFLRALMVDMSIFHYLKVILILIELNSNLVNSINYAK